MSFPADFGDDDRTAVVVLLSRAQGVQFEAMLGELRAIDPSTDDNDVVDRVFAIGLAAEWKTLQEITP